MKTPEEFKKNLVVCMDEAIEVAENGDAHDLLDFAHHAHARMSETLTYIQRLEASYSQLSKALCGKENATLEEVLQAASQVKAELALAVLQRDAAIRHLHGNCDICKWYETENCAYCIHDPVAWNSSEDNWEWVGGCPENTEVQEDDH